MPRKLKKSSDKPPGILVWTVNYIKKISSFDVFNYSKLTKLF